MQISDAEVMLMRQGHQDRRYAAEQIALANREMARLRAELAAVRGELSREKAKRHAAEARLRKH